MISSTFRRIALGALMLALAALPATAIDRAIESGTDFWVTLGDGSNLANFSANPLPADFFCSGSEPFAGRIILQGVPVATLPEGILGVTDTVIQRLDDAVFDGHGIAVTRIQMQAMEFEGVELFSNECGTFRMRLTLEGEQPITEMRIVRQSPLGGRFEAEIAVNVRMSFEPVDHQAEIVSVTRELRFPSYQGGVWSTGVGPGGRSFEGFVMIDTNSDGEADTFVPGMTRGFAAGWPSSARDREILHRASYAEAGTPVAGALKDAPAGARELPQSGLANLTGAATSEITYCPVGCHCSDSCGIHCPTVEIAAQ